MRSGRKRGGRGDRKWRRKQRRMRAEQSRTDQSRANRETAIDRSVHDGGLGGGLGSAQSIFTPIDCRINRRVPRREG